MHVDVQITQWRSRVLNRVDVIRVRPPKVMAASSGSIWGDYTTLSSRSGTYLQPSSSFCHVLRHAYCRMTRACCNCCPIPHTLMVTMFRDYNNIQCTPQPCVPLHLSTSCYSCTTRILTVSLHRLPDITKPLITQKTSLETTCQPEVCPSLWNTYSFSSLTASGAPSSGLPQSRAYKM